MPHAVLDVLGNPSELLHVYDLPQIYTKPAASELLNALSLLSLQPISWDRMSEVNSTNHEVKKQAKQQVDPEGVAKYLTTIIASDLKWIKDDEQKEMIWEAASARLAERSGRTGMPAMTRTFKIPTMTGEVEISVHEPALTSDNLGLKTWAASYLLAKRLQDIKIPSHQPFRVLELGSGTGLVGMAAAMVLGASVTLTDLPEIASNLAKNVRVNYFEIEAPGGRATTAILDWRVPSDMIPFSDNTSLDSNGNTEPFPIILAADAIYDKSHPALFASAVETWLAKTPIARVIVELPRREGFDAELDDFRRRMCSIGLTILEDGDEVGYDDWEGATPDELQEVTCWWSIWGWKA